MTDSSNDEFDPTAPDQREIGREMVDDGTELGSVMSHVYRGEIDRVGELLEYMAFVKRTATNEYVESADDVLQSVSVKGLLFVDELDRKRRQ